MYAIQPPGGYPSMYGKIGGYGLRRCVAGRVRSCGGTAAVCCGTGSALRRRDDGGYGGVRRVRRKGGAGYTDGGGCSGRRAGHFGVTPECMIY